MLGARPMIVSTSWYSASVRPCAATTSGVIGDWATKAPPPYLPGIGTLTYTFVVPVVGFIDSEILFAYGLFGFPAAAVQVYADTAEYSESLFYNGPVQTVSVAGAGTDTLLAGPARLLTAQVQATASTAGSTRIRQGAGGPILLTADATATSTNPASETVAFPDDTILSAGSLLQAVITGAGSSSIASVSYAYP